MIWKSVGTTISILTVTLVACSSQPGESPASSEAEWTSAIGASEGADDSQKTPAPCNCGNLTGHICGTAPGEDPKKCASAPKASAAGKGGFSADSINCVLDAAATVERFGGTGRWCTTADICSKDPKKIRDDYAICASWNDLKQCNSYSYPVGTQIACGPGQSVDPGTCGTKCGQDQGKTYPGGPTQLYILGTVATTGAPQGGALAGDACTKT